MTPNDANIDLYTLTFWGAVVLAVAVMAPLAGARARRLGFALVNLGFLATYLRADIVLVLGWLALTMLVVRLLPMPRLGAVAAAVGGAGILAAFLLHKSPWPIPGTLAAHATHAMTIVGFSYVALRWVDLAREVQEGRQPVPAPLDLVNYLLPFHMLSAGPIQAYGEYAAASDVVPPALGVRDALDALERITAGMFKKYVLANLIQRLLLTDFRAGGAYFFVEMQFGFIWLYLDFSAYSDIAVGIGKLMGVATPENFHRPYLARNPIEYWERWHISLSQFIRRNVFIPIQLALMRKTDGRHPLAVASVAFTTSFLLCGLWHGLSLNWLLWGAYHAVGLVICNLYKAALLRRLGRKGVNAYLARPLIRVLAIALTFEFVAFSFVIATVPLRGLVPWIR